MKFCCASERITPERPVLMKGFGDRSKLSEGVKDDLYVKTVLLEANKTILIITIDALGSDRSFVAGLKESLREKFGFSHDEVLINFSHTHHSIYLSGYGNREDDNNSQMISEKIIGMVEYGQNHMTEGSLLIGKGTSDFAVSRRRPTEIGIQWRPYYEANIDKDLFVLKLVDHTGTLKGILYNYGCHPTGMGPENLMLSNDYVGVTTRALEEKYPDASIVFLQGCAGELKPMKSADLDSFKSMSFEELEEAGRDLANDIIGVLESSSFETIRCAFKTKLVDPLLYTEQTSAEKHLETANDLSRSPFYRNAAQRAYQDILDGTIKDRMPLYIAVWHFDEETRLIAIQGEASTEYSLTIKKIFGSRKTLTLGYTNGTIVYIPSRKMIGEGGYEACGFFGGLRGPFLPEIEDIIIGQIVKADLSLKEQAAQ